MLSRDPLIIDRAREHAKLVELELPRIYSVEGTHLLPMKYGHGGFTDDCLKADLFAESCALILHRRDKEAQARSLAHARKYGSWFGLKEGYVRAAVSPDEVAAMAATNTADLARLQGLGLPHEVMAYEDITVASLKAAVDRLLGRDVLVTEPTTVKISP